VNTKPLHLCSIRQFTLGALLLFAVSLNGSLAQTNVRPLILVASSTNVTSRYITNVIQVSIPTNIFVDEYRTNWFRRDITNVVDLFRTNVVPQTKTNVLTVNSYVTNAVTAYRTNVNTVLLTNWETVVVARTNSITKPVTNVVDYTNTVLVERFATNLVVEYQTNLARAFQTNFKTLSLTNWETVLVMKTNWTTHPITNIVEIEAPAVPAVAVTTPAPSVANPESSPAASATDLTQKVEFDLTHIGQPNRPGQFPVRLVLLSVSGGVLPVHEWRVEKVDGSALVGGARPEFTGTLPAGLYKIVARVRADDGTVRTIRGNTEIKVDASEVRTLANGPTGSTASR